MINNQNGFVQMVLIVNFIIAAIYTTVMYIRTNMRFVFIRGAIMMLCPVTAPCCYFFSYILGMFTKEEDVDYVNLSLDKTKKEFEQEIDKEAEMKRLPIEEVLTVSTAKDRREAVINLLKTDVTDSMRLIRKAIDNEDPETVHYAASALTDIMSKFTAEVNRLQAVYDEDRTNREVNEEYVDAVLRILGSGALLGVEEMMYLYIYTGLLENLAKHHPAAVTGEQCAMMVTALYKEGKSQEAEKWAELSLEKWPDAEQSYLNVLYIKYHLGKEEDFYKCLKELAGSGLALSRKGLDIMRYWMKR